MPSFSVGRFPEIAYPAGKTFAAIAQELLVPFFQDQLKNKAHFADTPFALFETLPKHRQQFVADFMRLDVAGARQKFAGATMDYQADVLTLASGAQATMPNRTVADRLALSYAAYDKGLGLLLDFHPLPYKIYYAPMSRTHLRGYTLFPDGFCFDKTYLDLCRDLAAIQDPDFYFRTVDFAIRGDLAAIAALPPQQQAIIVDLVGIAIAEHHLLFNLGQHEGLKSRTGPFYNLTIDTLLHNHGVMQLTGSLARPALTRADSAYFLFDYTAKAELNALNARLMTGALRIPDLVPLAAITGADTLHAMIAFFMEHPESYDAPIQRSLRAVFAALPHQAPHINEALLQHAK